MTLVMSQWRAAMHRAAPTTTVIAVAGVVGDYYDRSRGISHPGVAAIAERAKISVRTVIRALKTLRDLGLLVRTSRGRRHLGLADEYRLVIPDSAREPERAPRVPRSSATRGPSSRSVTTGRGSALPDVVETALDAHASLGRQERARLAQRLAEMLRRGDSARSLSQALTRPLPAATASPAALLHARLIDVAGMTEQGALDRAARWGSKRPRRARRGARVSTAPRRAEAFPETSVAIAGW